MLTLDGYQIKAIEKLKNRAILCGDTGSGKSRTALAYYFFRECGGSLPVNGKGIYNPFQNPKDLYIITTAKKRNELEWDHECKDFLMAQGSIKNPCKVKLVIDSWNNIKKYVGIRNAFFIFDEQKVSGSGAWVNSFLKINNYNDWILLSATPGDKWSDYIPVFVANGFYRSKTAFSREHIVYNPYVKFPQVQKYLNTGKLIKYRNDILVTMDYHKQTRIYSKNIPVDYDAVMYEVAEKKRWNPFTNCPIKNVSEYCYTLRRVVNSDESRIEAVKDILTTKDRAIIFYNFDYERDMLIQALSSWGYPYSEWNGHNHNEIPNKDKWAYLVQYTAGAEGWNCITTDTVIFYSNNYSYRIMKQAAGRIDRRNTKYKDLYYYHLISGSKIDRDISVIIREKKTFNESQWAGVKFEKEQKD